jgi:hypothetical protein
VLPDSAARAALRSRRFTLRLTPTTVFSPPRSLNKHHIQNTLMYFLSVFVLLVGESKMPNGQVTFELPILQGLGHEIESNFGQK